jgi:hypothetical protein
MQVSHLFSWEQFVGMLHDAGQQRQRAWSALTRCMACEVDGIMNTSSATGRIDDVRRASDVMACMTCV